MLVQEKLPREAPAKIGRGQNDNYQNKDKKDGSSSNKEVHAINHYIEYTPVRTTYTYASERLLPNEKIDLPKIKLEIEVIRWAKSFNLTKYCIYHRAWGHDIEN